MKLKVMTKDRFVEIVEANVARRMPYMEAVVEACEKSGIEVENARHLINNRIKKLIRREATVLNMMKRTGRRLPI